MINVFIPHRWNNDDYETITALLDRTKYNVRDYSVPSSSPFDSIDRRYNVALIVKVVVSKNIYFLFLQVIRYCSVPDVSINKLSTFIGNHVRHRILPDHHHFE